MSTVGKYVCGSCGYASSWVLLGAGGELYEDLLGRCDPCRELRTFHPDRPWCESCGGRVVRVLPDEDDAVGCPRCAGNATLSM